MRNNRLIYAICGLLAIGMVSCLPDVRMEQKQGEAYRNIGEAYMEQKDYTSALKQFLQAEKLYPDDPFLQNDLGLAYRIHNFVESAELVVYICDGLSYIELAVSVMVLEFVLPAVIPSLVALVTGVVSI